MWKRAHWAAWAAWSLMAAGTALAAPPLTLIQDTLYRADGTPFAGSAEVSWTSFVAWDGTSIPQGSLTAQVVGGLVRLRLVPGTNAVPVTNYTVKFNTGGTTLYTEVWAVPPSTAALEIRQVRVSSQSGGGTPAPPPASDNLQIGDVEGLQAELSARIVRSPLLQVNRAAVINENGQIMSAVGAAGDCVRADGTTGPCGDGSGGGSLPLMVDAEMPVGVVNGVNAVFVLNYGPSPMESLRLYRNGILLKAGVDYTLSGNTITFQAGALPETGDVLQAAYRAPVP
ncbi:MAG: hypothetical protein M9913_20015 [Bryobacteraceae bacterium]|nr:hypothetical protein [Solibacteraceae bacterium]MCL4842602.1 hypothetical protein [Bryobacteraceae bacterium]MCO5353139.1 hypothetical protein [Bryobacteraceae bacterium]